MASELGQSLLDTDHAAQLDEHLVVGELIAQLPGGRAVMISVHCRPQSPEILDQLLQRAARWMAQPLQILTMGLARTSCLEAVDLVVPATAQNIVDGIGNHRNENPDRCREPGQRYLLLIDHPSMVRRGTCAALGRASGWPTSAIASASSRPRWKPVWSGVRKISCRTARHAKRR